MRVRGDVNYIDQEKGAQDKHVCSSSYNNAGANIARSPPVYLHVVVVCINYSPNVVKDAAECTCGV